MLNIIKLRKIEINNLIILTVNLSTSTQPANIKQFPKYGFNERNPTNHVAGVFVQALVIPFSDPGQ